MAKEALRIPARPARDISVAAALLPKSCQPPVKLSRRLQKPASGA